MGTSPGKIIYIVAYYSYKKARVRVPELVIFAYIEPPCQITSKAFVSTIYIIYFKKKMTRKVREERQNLGTTREPIN